MADRAAWLCADPPHTSRATSVRLATISVHGLQVEADIGVLPHEIGALQPLLLSLTLRVRPVFSDQLDDTIDYIDVVALAEALAAKRTGLIETFAHRLANACLNHPAVEEADILVEKPNALARGTAGARIVLCRA